MARRPKKKKSRGGSPVPAPSPAPRRAGSPTRPLLFRAGLPLLLALVTFLVYAPSLGSDFVYDAKRLIEEGFMTSLANLPALLSLQVVHMDLILGARPGQLLYEMLLAAVWGKDPFGYHLGSNLLHAANAALLFILLLRLARTQVPDLTGPLLLKLNLAAAAVVLLFALHPIVVEPVSGTSYASDLLVTFFTLLALLSAVAFRPENRRRALLTGLLATLSAFAAVTCKESGVAVVPLLVVYWFLFRRHERGTPWAIFLSAAAIVTALFLLVRFSPAPDHAPPLGYLGGSLSQVFLIQPRLWVFMIGKLFWPVDFSADYTLENIDGLSTPAACALLTVVLLLQGWLAYRSPIGALGVAIYWLGLATVSNFMPLNRFLADRFYYLPLAGGAMQLFALLLLLLPNKTAFRALLAACLVAVFPLTLLTVIRQQVFTNNFTLWTDTIKVSPFSSGAHNGLGSALAHRDQIDAAIAEYHKALQLQPDWFQAEINLGNAYVQKGNIPLAVHFYEKALDDYPRIPDAHNNLGVLLLRQGNVDAAMAHFQKALELNPYYELAHVNLGTVLMRKGRLQDAVAEFQEALQIEPGEPQAQAGLAAAEAKLGAPVTSP